MVRITVLMHAIFYWPPFISVKDFGVKTVLQFTSRIKYLLVEWQSVHTFPIAEQGYCGRKGEENHSLNPPLRVELAKKHALLTSQKKQLRTGVLR